MADQIPRVWMKPTAFVVNTDHINRLRKNCKSKMFRWNSVQLQSDTSDVCGQYCIMFLRYMCKSLSIEKFLINFSKNLVKNDDIVRSFVQYENVDANFVGNSGYLSDIYKDVVLKCLYCNMI